MSTKLTFRVLEVVLGILLAVAVFATGTAAQSSPVQPSKEQSSASQQHAENIGNPDSKETQSLWVPTDSVGLYTLVLCVFTGVLAAVSIFQGVMLIRSDKTARIAANAADLSARAAIALELPVIKIEPEGLSFGRRKDDAGCPVSYLTLHRISFFNHGRTQAIPTKISWGWTVGKTLPEIPEYKFVKGFDAGTVLNPDTATPTRNILADKPFETGLDQQDIIYKGTVTLWFYCRLEFNDFIDNTHFIGRCWRYEPSGKGTLIPDAEGAYSYRTENNRNAALSQPA